MSKTGTLNYQNYKNDDGNVTGGFANAVGLSITWQDGPLGQGENRQPPNGAFVEDVLEACLERLKAFQGTPSACKENAGAIRGLESALDWLDLRTQRRIQEGVEGTHAK